MWDISPSPHPTASAAAAVQTQQRQPAHTSSPPRPGSLPHSGSAGAATSALAGSFGTLQLRHSFLVFSMTTTLYFCKERGVSLSFGCGWLINWPKILWSTWHGWPANWIVRFDYCGMDVR